MPAQCTMAWSSKPSVSTSIWRFLPLTFCPHHSHADRCKPPFFGAFHALAIDNGGGGAGFSFRLLAACDVERVMNAIQHTIALPPGRSPSVPQAEDRHRACGSVIRPPWPEL